MFKWIDRMIDWNDWHFRMRIIKSILRIVAALFLLNICFYAGLFFILAEILGIVEEL